MKSRKQPVPVPQNKQGAGFPYNQQESLPNQLNPERPESEAFHHFLKDRLPRFKAPSDLTRRIRNIIDESGDL